MLALLLFGMGVLAGCAGIPPASVAPHKYTTYPGAESGVIRTQDGLALYTAWWKPVNEEPKAVILLLHGTAAHSGVYTPWAQYAVSQGYAVFAMDMRGWGQSQGFGRRGYVRAGYADYVGDLPLAFAEVQRAYPGKRIYLQGESLGAGVALHASIQGGFPVDGLILNAPPVYVNLKVGPGRLPEWIARPAIWNAGLLGRVAPNFPLYPMNTDLGESWIWNKAIFDDWSRRELRKDPHMTHSAIPAVYVTALGKAAAHIRRHAADIREPFILLQGDRDYLVNSRPSGKLLMNRASSTDKTHKVYPGMSHCTLHDKGRGAVWIDIIDWLDARVPATQTLPEEVAALRQQGRKYAGETPEETFGRLSRTLQ
ncbi:MAG: alpha/beta fold hydrolase [Pseudomonadota bacterium]